MVLEDILSKVLSSGYIPIKIVQETNWLQFGISTFVTLLTASFFLLLIYSDSAGNPFKSNKAKKRFSELTKRPSIIINHKQSAFSSSMIDSKTTSKVIKAMEKLDGQDFNLILQSPGGNVFDAVQLSKVLKSYRGKIHTYISRYAMSGASLLALSTDKIYFNRYSCIGPCDVQVGSLLSSGSAAAWKEIIQKKAIKANDNAFIFNRVGRQVTSTMRGRIKYLVQNKVPKNKVDEVTELFVNGEKEHIYQVNYNKLKKLGFNNINMMSREENRLLTQMVG